MNANNWIDCNDRLPPDREVVETKIDDVQGGCRNVQPLYLDSGRLWFLSDGSMYVYYTPTHWRPLNDCQKAGMKYRAIEAAKQLLKKAEAMP